MFGEQNYDYFCFLAACACCWGVREHHERGDEYIAWIGGHLGLKIDKVDPLAQKDMVKTAKQCIDNHVPVLLRVKDNGVFYAQGYRHLSDEYQHFIVVSGYDPERDIIFVRDKEQLLNRSNHLLVEDGVGLFEMQLTTSMFQEICGYIVDQDVYTVREMEHSNPIRHIGDLLNCFQHKFDCDRNQFADYIRHIDGWKMDMNQSIQTFYGSVFVIFTILEKACIDIGDAILDDSYRHFKTEYLRVRKQMVLRVQIDKARYGRLPPEKEQEMIDRTIELDQGLQLWILRIHRALTGKV